MNNHVRFNQNENTENWFAANSVYLLLIKRISRLWKYISCIHKSANLINGSTESTYIRISKRNSLG